MLRRKRHPHHKKESRRSETPQERERPQLPESVKAYGDVVGDGIVQLSFTLPMPSCDEARVAAQMLCEKMGLKNVRVVHMEAMDPNFTYFVVYAVCEAQVNVSEIDLPRPAYPQFGFDEINNMIQEKVGRKIVILGACIGTDAHTVGIDAIFNMKGYMGHHGLERYPMFDAINLRAQVDVKDLAEAVVKKQADAVLVSRVVTQRNSHIEELKKFLAELKARDNVPRHLIKICGGPRITHKEARELGYDAGFGPGTLPSEVASFIANEVVKRL